MKNGLKSSHVSARPGLPHRHCHGHQRALSLSALVKMRDALPSRSTGEVYHSSCMSHVLRGAPSSRILDIPPVLLQAFNLNKNVTIQSQYKLKNNVVGIRFKKNETMQPEIKIIRSRGFLVY